MMVFFLVVSDDLPRKKLQQIYKPPTPDMLAYLDFSVSTTGILAGVKVSYSLYRTVTCRNYRWCPGSLRAE